MDLLLFIQFSSTFNVTVDYNSKRKILRKCIAFTEEGSFLHFQIISTFRRLISTRVFRWKTRNTTKNNIKLLGISTRQTLTWNERHVLSENQRKILLRGLYSIGPTDFWQSYWWLVNVRTNPHELMGISDIT